MRTRIIIMCVAMLATAVLAGAARADWAAGTPAKWFQMPDLTPTGMDVNATFFGPATGGPGQYPYVKVLADDFPCTTTGPITDIHIWGSWLNDFYDQGLPVSFKLSIHSDVPKGPNGEYSHPGGELWQHVFNPGQYAVQSWATALEQFYEPNTNQIIGQDHQVWQYNFLIPSTAAFVQQGTAAKPMVYWLDVQALTPDPGMIFGWKTTQDHWGDDAVYADTEVFGGPPILSGTVAPALWHELIYPSGVSRDMAFVITPEPATMALLGLGIAGLVARRRGKK